MKVQQTQTKIQDLQTAKQTVTKWKDEGHSIVFTNGCFDLLHLGHIDYLEKAAFLGDKLVVGINTDNSVSTNKGSLRPVTDEVSRSRIIAGLEFVDLVILFEEDTPYNLIAAILPDILVKGNDWLAENIIGADLVQDNGGKIQTIELVKGYSTSNIINKIQSSVKT